jgi:hypothetical protein
VHQSRPTADRYIVNGIRVKVGRQGRGCGWRRWTMIGTDGERMEAKLDLDLDLDVSCQRGNSAHRIFAVALEKQEFLFFPANTTPRT